MPELAVPDETQHIMVRKIPVDLWRRLKSRAAMEGETIQTTIAKAIERYLDEAR